MRVFSDAFFDYLAGGIRDERSIGSTISAYTSIREKLRELPVKERHKVIEMGTTSWYLVKDITPTLDSYPKAKLEFDTCGIFFFLARTFNGSKLFRTIILFLSS